MPEDQHFAARLRFGVFDLDLRAGELRKHGLRIRIQDQPFQVLAMLVAHAGEVVTREDLQKKLWPTDTFVDFDHGLNKAINKIRNALGDSAVSPRFVETVAHRGYRFLAEVKVADAAPVRSPERATQHYPTAEASGPAGLAGNVVTPEHYLPSLVWKMSAFALLLLIASLATWKLHSWNRPSPVIRSLAVLPLESFSGDASQDYFADGMTDELITDLGQITALRVISRTSVMQYKHARKPLPQIARELNVDAVVEGTVLHSGGQVRITAQLIEARADKHLWSKSYEGELRDALALQNKVARAIADQVRIKLNPQEEAALKNVKAVNPEAYESYLKGRFFWNKRTADGLKKAIEYFNEAIEKDPKYGQAYTGLADSYALLGNSDFAVLTPQEAFPKAKAAATKALELDNSLSEAHTSLAFCLSLFEWNWEAAEKEFQEAIALNPSYATAHQWYALQLSVMGRHREAIAEMSKAENLDPLSLIISADMADVLFAAHQYEESMLQSRKALDMDPNFAISHFELGQVLAQKKMYNEAIEELQKANKLSGGDATCISTLGYAYAVSGSRSEALKLMSDLKSRSDHRFSYAAHIALIQASLGEKDLAMASLEKAYTERFDALALRSPAFDPLRSDPRFQDLMRRIGLPQ
jgi:TolB-like protein/DNA-binding winged helix-turn-helix (wHTH) protein/Flp pilus assembly protein TadD